MYLKVSLLREAIYNVLLWTPGKGEAKKSQWGGNVEVELRDQGFSFLSTDGYVAVKSGTRQLHGLHYVVKGEDLKLVLSELKVAESDEVEVNASDGKLFIGKTAIEIQSSGDTQEWGYIRKLTEFGGLEEPNMKHFKQFYLDPRRLQKFSLVEPRADYPLAMKPMETDNGQDVFIWKYGPRLQGILAPLTAELLFETYIDDADEVLW